MLYPEQEPEPATIYCGGGGDAGGEGIEGGGLSGGGETGGGLRGGGEIGGGNFGGAGLHMHTVFAVEVAAPKSRLPTPAVSF